HHHDHDEHECHEHHHHHDHDEHECHEHHHHDHDEHECHEHHHHDHGEHCTCGCHDHHHADETFTSWGFETARVYAREEIEAILAALDTGDYGMILRAKGMVNGGDGWIYFDYVPEESGVRSGSPCFTGRICVIGVDLDEDKLAELFHKSH
ncbi:MAG: GTP-binding protein, partial [Clostridia bacterium]|nr:GTP-binding protein [Clostridia bacterium]